MNEGAREANKRIELDRLKFAEEARAKREDALLKRLDRIIELLEKLEERTRLPMEVRFK